MPDLRHLPAIFRRLNPAITATQRMPPPEAPWPAPGMAHTVQGDGPAQTSIGPEGQNNDQGTGTAADRSTPSPDSNLTSPAPSGSDMTPPQQRPGNVAPDSRPVADHGLLDGTRQGPAQAQ